MGYTLPFRKLKGGEGLGSSSRSGLCSILQPTSHPPTCSFIHPLTHSFIYLPSYKICGHARLQKQDTKTQRKPQERLKLAHQWLREPDTPKFSLAFSQGEREKPVLFAHLRARASLNQLGPQASLISSSPPEGVNKAIIWQFWAIRQAQDANSFKNLDWIAKSK